MLIRDCMTKTVELANPDMTIREAAKKMRDGDFGILPIGDGDRLVGMVTDRDIAIRAVADGKDADQTKLSEIMSKKVLYCFEDQSIEDVAKNMGDNQVRRLVVLNREKRLVGMVSLGDVALSEDSDENAEEALSEISRPGQNQNRSQNQEHRGSVQ